VLLLHGYLASHWQFRHIVPDLVAAGREVIAFDWPGFGESDRPDAAEYRYDAAAFLATLVGVLDALGLEKVDVLGHSMGAGIALYAAARRPERIDRLVAIDPLCYDWTVPLEGRLALAPYVGLSLFRAVSTRALVRRTMKRYTYRDPAIVTEDWVDYVWERMNRPGGMEAAVAAMRLVAEPKPIARTVRAVRSPTMIVWGEDDRLFPASHASRLQSDVSGSEVKLIPACGHSPPEERPRELCEVVLPFLGERDGRRLTA
jgi:pimeloyl-ACP methyl ester carboxylesterase